MTPATAYDPLFKNYASPWSVIAFMLLFIGNPAWANKEYISTDPQSIANVCADNGMVSNLKGESDCIACHTNADPDNPPSAPDDRNTNGKIYEIFRTNPLNQALLDKVLNTFCIAQEPKSYHVIVNPPAGGTITSQPSGIYCGASAAQCSFTFNSNTTAILTSTPLVGYRFHSWTGACSNFSSEKCMLQSDSTVGANFEVINHMISIQKSGDGSVISFPRGLNCGNACSSDFAHASVVTLVAIPGTDQIFQGWSGDCSGNDNICVVVMDQPKSVSAAFKTSLTDGICGTANNVFTPTAPVEPNLCMAGLATPPANMHDGRFSWSCLGIGGNTRSSRCYSLVNNGKNNQPPLRLEIGKMPSAKGALLRVEGGAGRGKLKIVKTTTPDTRCKTSITGRKIRVKFGGASGTCTLSVRKLQDKTYNEVESPPLVINVNR